MNTTKRLVSALVSIAFLLNTVAADLALAQTYSTDKLATAAKTDDILGTEFQDMRAISMWFTGCVAFMDKKGFPVNLDSIRDPKILPDTIIDGMKNVQIFRYEATQDDSTGTIKIKVRRRDGFSASIYYIEYSKDGSVRVYPEGKAPAAESGAKPEGPPPAGTAGQAPAANMAKPDNVRPSESPVEEYAPKEAKVIYKFDIKDPLGEAGRDAFFAAFEKCKAMIEAQKKIELFRDGSIKRWSDFKVERIDRKNGVIEIKGTDYDFTSTYSINHDYTVRIEWATGNCIRISRETRISERGAPDTDKSSTSSIVTFNRDGLVTALSSRPFVGGRGVGSPQSEERARVVGKAGFPLSQIVFLPNSFAVLGYILTPASSGMHPDISKGLASGPNIPVYKTPAGAKSGKGPAAESQPGLIKKFALEDKRLATSLGKIHKELTQVFSLKDDLGDLFFKAALLYYERAYFLGEVKDKELIQRLSELGNIPQYQLHARLIAQLENRKMPDAAIMAKVWSELKGSPEHLAALMRYFDALRIRWNLNLAASGRYHSKYLSKAYQKEPRRLREWLDKLLRRMRKVKFTFRYEDWKKDFARRRLDGGKSERQSADDRFGQRIVLIHNDIGATVPHPHQQAFFLPTDFIPESKTGVERFLEAHPKNVSWYEYEGTGGCRFGELFGWPVTVSVVEGADKEKVTTKVYEATRAILDKGLRFSVLLGSYVDQNTQQMRPRFFIFVRKDGEQSLRPNKDKFGNMWATLEMSGGLVIPDRQKFDTVTIEDVLKGYDETTAGPLYQVLGLKQPQNIPPRLSSKEISAYIDLFYIPSRADTKRLQGAKGSKPGGDYLAYYHWPVSEKAFRLDRQFSTVPNFVPFAPHGLMIYEDRTGDQDMPLNAVRNMLLVWKNVLGQTQEKGTGASSPAAAAIETDTLKDRIEKALTEERFEYIARKIQGLYDSIIRLEGYLADISSETPMPSDKEIAKSWQGSLEDARNELSQICDIIRHSKKLEAFLDSQHYSKLGRIIQEYLAARYGLARPQAPRDKQGPAAANMAKKRPEADAETDITANGIVYVIGSAVDAEVKLRRYSSAGRKELEKALDSKKRPVVEMLSKVTRLRVLRDARRMVDDKIWNLYIHRPGGNRVPKGIDERLWEEYLEKVLGPRINVVDEKLKRALPPDSKQAAIYAFNAIALAPSLLGKPFTPEQFSARYANAQKLHPRLNMQPIADPKIILDLLDVDGLVDRSGSEEHPIYKVTKMGLNEVKGARHIIELAEKYTKGGTLATGQAAEGRAKLESLEDFKSLIPEASAADIATHLMEGSIASTFIPYIVERATIKGDEKLTQALSLLKETLKENRATATLDPNLTFSYVEQEEQKAFAAKQGRAKSDTSPATDADSNTSGQLAAAESIVIDFENYMKGKQAQKDAQKVLGVALKVLVGKEKSANLQNMVEDIDASEILVWVKLKVQQHVLSDRRKLAKLTAIKFSELPTQLPGYADVIDIIHDRIEVILKARANTEYAAAREVKIGGFNFIVSPTELDNLAGIGEASNTLMIDAVVNMSQWAAYIDPSVDWVGIRERNREILENIKDEDKTESYRHYTPSLVNIGDGAGIFLVRAGDGKTLVPVISIQAASRWSGNVYFNSVGYGWHGVVTNITLADVRKIIARARKNDHGVRDNLAAAAWQKFYRQLGQQIGVRPAAKAPTTSKGGDVSNNKDVEQLLEKIHGLMARYADNIDYMKVKPEEEESRSFTLAELEAKAAAETKRKQAIEELEKALQILLSKTDRRTIKAAMESLAEDLSMQIKASAHDRFGPDASQIALERFVDLMANYYAETSGATAPVSAAKGRVKPVARPETKKSPSAANMAKDRAKPGTITNIRVWPFSANEQRYVGINEQLLRDMIVENPGLQDELDKAAEIIHTIPLPYDANKKIAESGFKFVTPTIHPFIISTELKGACVILIKVKGEIGIVLMQINEKGRIIKSGIVVEGHERLGLHREGLEAGELTGTIDGSRNMTPSTPGYPVWKEYFDQLEREQSAPAAPSQRLADIINAAYEAEKRAHEKIASGAIDEMDESVALSYQVMMARELKGLKGMKPENREAIFDKCGLLLNLEAAYAAIKSDARFPVVSMLYRMLGDFNLGNDPAARLLKTVLPQKGQLARILPDNRKRVVVGLIAREFTSEELETLRDTLSRPVGGPAWDNRIKGDPRFCSKLIRLGAILDAAGVPNNLPDNARAITSAEGDSISAIMKVALLLQILFDPIPDMWTTRGELTAMLRPLATEERGKIALLEKDLLQILEEHRFDTLKWWEKYIPWYTSKLVDLCEASPSHPIRSYFYFSRSHIWFDFRRNAPLGKNRYLVPCNFGRISRLPGEDYGAVISFDEKRSAIVSAYTPQEILFMECLMRHCPELRITAFERPTEDKGTIQEIKDGKPVKGSVNTTDFTKLRPLDPDEDGAHNAKIGTTGETTPATPAAPAAPAPEAEKPDGRDKSEAPNMAKPANQPTSEPVNQEAADDVRGLYNNIKDTVRVTQDSVIITDPAGFRARTVDYLAFESGLSQNPDVKAAAQDVLREAALSFNLKLASIHDFYVAKRHGKWSNMTVPAVNGRSDVYHQFRQLLRVAKEDNMRTPVLELARSEMRYTGQDAAEFTAVSLAAAIKEGYEGLIFAQGDHYQVNKEKFAKDKEREKELQAIEGLIRKALLAGMYNIDLDPSTLVDEKILDEILQFENSFVDRYLTVHPELLTGLDDNGRKSLRRRLVDEIEMNKIKFLSAEESAAIRELYQEMHRLNIEVTMRFIRYIRKLEKELNIPTVSVGIEERHIDNPKHKNNPSTVLGSATLAQSIFSLCQAEGLEGPSKLSLQTGTMHGLGGEVDFGIYQRHLEFWKNIGINVFVQHGASTLERKEDFNKMQEGDVGEVHLATEYQKIELGIVATMMPEVGERMTQYLLELMGKDPKIEKFRAMWNLAFGNPELAIRAVKDDDKDREKKIALYNKLAPIQAAKSRPDIIAEILGDSMPKGLKGALKDLVKELSGPFKKELWNLPPAVRAAIDKALYEEFSTIFAKLGASNTGAIVEEILPFAAQPIVLAKRPEAMQSAIETPPESWKDPKDLPLEKRVVMLISGGEAAGVNNYFALLARKLAAQGMSLELVKFGLDGLVKAKVEFDQRRVWVDWAKAEKIMDMPGAAEGTARVKLNDKNHPEYMDNAIANLKGYCKTVIIIGGNDHIGEADNLAKRLKSNGIEDMLVIALPKTIDRDTKVYPIGADSAGEHANELVRRASARARPGSGNCVVVQAMGRDMGYLAVRAGDLNDPTVVVAIPEYSYNPKTGEIKSSPSDIVEAVAKRMVRYGAATVIVSEGYGIKIPSEDSPEYKEYMEKNPILAKVLANKFLKAKFDRFRTDPKARDPQGNFMVTELGIGDFIVEALSLELKLFREQNLFFEDIGYSYRARQPNKLDRAIAERATTAAFQLITDEGARNDAIRRGGVCIAAHRAIRKVEDIKIEIIDLKDATGKVDLTDSGIYSEEELRNKNILGVPGSSIGNLPYLPLVGRGKARGYNFRIAVDAIGSQAESGRDMKRPNVCVIARDDADEIIRSLRTRAPTSKADVYVWVRTNEATRYYTSAGRATLSDIVKDAYGIYEKYGFLNLVVPGNLPISEKDELIPVLKKNPASGALIEAAKQDGKGNLIFGRRLVELLFTALQSEDVFSALRASGIELKKTMSGVRKNILGESLNRLPGEEDLLIAPVSAEAAAAPNNTATRAAKIKEAMAKAAAEERAAAPAPLAPSGFGYGASAAPKPDEIKLPNWDAVRTWTIELLKIGTPQSYREITERIVREYGSISAYEDEIPQSGSKKSAEEAKSNLSAIASAISHTEEGVEYLRSPQCSEESEGILSNFSVKINAAPAAQEQTLIKDVSVNDIIAVIEPSLVGRHSKSVLREIALAIQAVDALKNRPLSELTSVKIQEIERAFMQPASFFVTKSPVPAAAPAPLTPSGLGYGAPAAPEALSSSAQRKSGVIKRILIVDHNSSRCHAMKSFLASSYTTPWSRLKLDSVEAVKTGSEAIKLIEGGQRPDLIVTYTELGGTHDGIQLAGVLKDIPFILISEKELPDEKMPANVIKTLDNVGPSFTGPLSQTGWTIDKLIEVVAQPAAPEAPKSEEKGPPPAGTAGQASAANMAKGPDASATPQVEVKVVVLQPHAISGGQIVAVEEVTVAVPGMGEAKGRDLVQLAEGIRTLMTRVLGFSVTVGNNAMTLKYTSFKEQGREKTVVAAMPRIAHVSDDIREAIQDALDFYYAAAAASMITETAQSQPGKTITSVEQLIDGVNQETALRKAQAGSQPYTSLGQVIDGALGKSATVNPPAAPPVPLAPSGLRYGASAATGIGRNPQAIANLYAMVSAGNFTPEMSGIITSALKGDVANIVRLQSMVGKEGLTAEQNIAITAALSIIGEVRSGEEIRARDAKIGAAIAGQQVAEAVQRQKQSGESEAPAQVYATPTPVGEIGLLTVLNLDGERKLEILRLFAQATGLNPDVVEKNADEYNVLSNSYDGTEFIVMTYVGTLHGILHTPKKGAPRFESTATPEVLESQADARAIGTAIKTDAENRYTLIVDSNLYKDGEYKNDMQGILMPDGSRIGPADRFNLERANTSNVENILAHVKDASRTIVQVAFELSEPDIQKLKEKAPGLRVMRVDTADPRYKEEYFADYRQLYRFDIYAMMLAARQITEEDIRMKEASAAYRLLSFFLRSHCKDGEEIAADDYLSALVMNNMSFIIRHALSYKPSAKWHVPTYHSVAVTLISA